ncbi:protein Dom3Z-like protein [Leptotrombidium deliense]|uniref:Decapping nuclease n=1 Tax=Leptotrombidium deliense TaxID=299467 RepID=A0A443SST1_9ACAR|nr:protein Dom3Z-like protein [Leptotrombidium deliense]
MSAEADTHLEQHSSSDTATCNSAKIVNALNVRQCIHNKEIKLREPANIGYYSLERAGVTTLKYNEDLSQLKYLYLPTEKKFCFDLTDGYSNQFECEHSVEGLSNLLKWVLNNKYKFEVANSNHSDKSLNTDFICFRGLLSLILNTPYERKEDWCIHAVKFNGTIYMLAKLTERRLREEENKSEYAQKASFGGYRFEEYVCTEKQNNPPRTQLIDGLNRNEFNVVFRSRLNSHSLVYGAEVDCIKPNGDPKKLDFVEIKTTKEFENKRQHDTFCRYKALKWWSQSYLAGIKTIVCGYRDDNFHVQRVDTYSANSLCNLGAEFWNSSVCLNFLDSFLTFVKKCVTKEDQNITYEFYWSPNSNEIVCKELMLQDAIIPQWFRDFFQ